MGVLGIATLVAGAPAIFWGSFLVSSTAVLLYCALIWRHPVRIFRQNQKLQQETEIIISEHGLDTRSAGASSHTEWTVYREVISDRLVHLLYRDRDVYSVLPRAAFATEAEDERFREVVAQKVHAP